jgi:hypothetical protein
MPIWQREKFTMFIFWGTKLVKARLGYVADYCLICSRIQIFEIQKRSLRSHIYYLPYGEEKSVQHLKLCKDCSTEQVANIRSYKTIVDQNKIGSGLREMIDQTFPNIEDVYGQRLEADKNIVLGPKAIGQTSWKAMICEPFGVYERKFLEFSSQIQIDLHAFISILVALALPVISAMILELSSIDIETRTNIIIGAIIFGIVLMIVQVRGVKKRHLLKEIYPKLAKSLGKFSAHRTDIQSVFEELKGEGYQVAVKGSYRQLEKFF